MAKYATIGSCPAISSCQIWAAAPSSASRAAPKMAMWPSTVARAASDIATGRKALGCFIIVERLIRRSPERDIDTIHGNRLIIKCFTSESNIGRASRAACVDWLMLERQREKLRHRVQVVDVIRP